jgi:hypothetical protein
MAVPLDVGAVVGDEFIDDGHRTILRSARGADVDGLRYLDFVASR